MLIFKTFAQLILTKYNAVTVVNALPFHYNLLRAGLFPTTVSISLLTDDINVAFL